MASARMALAWVWADTAEAVGMGELAVSDMGGCEKLGVRLGFARRRKTTDFIGQAIADGAPLQPGGAPAHN